MTLFPSLQYSKFFSILPHSHLLLAFPTRPAVLPQFIPANQLPAVAAHYQHCEMNLFWIAEYNGLYSSSQPPPDPRVRMKFPSVDTFSLVDSSIRTLMENRR